MGQCDMCGAALRAGNVCRACVEADFGSLTYDSSDYGADSDYGTDFGADSPFDAIASGFEGMGLPNAANQLRAEIVFGGSENVALGPGAVAGGAENKIERGRGTVVGLLAGAAGPMPGYGATGAAGPMGGETGAAGPVEPSEEALHAKRMMLLEVASKILTTATKPTFEHVVMLPATPVEVDACPMCGEPMPYGWEKHRDKMHPPYRVPWYVRFLKWAMTKKEHHGEDDR
jgi:hypothetical protein